MIANERNVRHETGLEGLAITLRHMHETVGVRLEVLGRGGHMHETARVRLDVFGKTFFVRRHMTEAPQAQVQKLSKLIIRKTKM